MNSLVHESRKDYVYSFLHYADFINYSPGTFLFCLTICWGEMWPCIKSTGEASQSFARDAPVDYQDTLDTSLHGRLPQNLSSYYIGCPGRNLPPI